MAGRLNALSVLVSLFMSFFVLASSGIAALAQADDPSSPEEPVKLIFIHHSTGENWLSDDYGGLGQTLDANNYFVSDTNYGWGPDSIGDRTDIVNWPEWFGPERNEDALDALFNESGQNSYYTRTLEDSGGENEIILFKSCFPNSELYGSPDDEPAPGDYDFTVGSAIYIYNLLLDYFITRPDKMFVVITAPPLINSDNAANARAFNTWLVEDWLAEYPGSNVFVFDFYNILTGPDNHHRFVDGDIEYTIEAGMDTAYYPSEDDHPSVEGSQKATEEFIPMLNVFYHRWRNAVPQDTTQTDYQPPTTSDEENQPDEDIQPGNAPEEGLIAGFEGGAEGWQSNIDSSGSSLECGSDSETGYSGESLRIDFDLVPAGNAGCGISFDGLQDWSGSDGLSFYMMAEDASLTFRIIITSGAEGQMAPFEATVMTPEGSDSDWKPVFLPWSALELAYWADVSNADFDAAHIAGMEFNFGTETEHFENVVHIDELRLGESGVAEEEQDLVEPVAEDAEESEPVEEQDSGGFLSSCPLSTGLPLAVVLFSIVRLGAKRRKQDDECER